MPHGAKRLNYLMNFIRFGKPLCNSAFYTIVCLFLNIMLDNATDEILRT